jgi:PAS domain S-box-containing protein
MAAVLSVAALLLAPGARAAETFIPRFQQFGVEDGLSQSSAVCMAQDGEGFLWIGTYAGLNRFDGYSFKHYGTVQSGPGALTDGNIRALLTDASGTLWVGTRSGGLFRHDRLSDSFTAYQHDPSQAQSIPSNEVLAIHQDSQGVMRVGTAGGLAEFQRSASAFTRVPVSAQAPKGPREIVAVTEDERGAIWAASRKMVFSLDRTSGELTPVRNPELAQELSKAQINSLFTEGRGILWIVTDVTGLFRLDLNTGSVERHMPTGGAFKMLRDRWGSVWVATSSGIGRLVEKNGGRRLEFFSNSPYDHDCISQNDVLSLFEDASGILWAGTYSGGLNKLISGSRWFASYRHVPGDAAALPGKEVSAVRLGRDGSLWVGLRYEGLARLDRSRRVAERFLHSPRDPSSLAEDQINCVLEDSRGRVWVGLVESGVSILDRETGAFSHMRHDPMNPQSLSQDKIWWLFEDREGIVWAGTSKGGLNRIDPATGRVKRYLNDPKNPASISHDRVRHVIQARDGALWIGTNAGLNRFDPKTETFTCYRNDPKNPESLSNDRVTPIVEDAAGFIWAGTDSGLNRLDPRTDKIRRYTEKDGLYNDGIQGMALDAKGRLWMSTFKGISRLDPATGEIRNYTRRDGLVGSEFYMNAFDKGADGELFFAGFSGINAFYPEDVRANNHAPPVAVTALLVNNTPRLRGGDTALPEVTLSPSDQSLTLEFAAMDFTNPPRNQYAYMLEGFDAKWVESGDNRRATYTNLDPGNYRFLVKASNDEGFWNATPMSVTVAVVPPFWKTWWFRTLMALAALGAVFGGYSFRLSALKARRKELEETVARQTASLRHEIDERIKAAAELRESQQSFQAIFQYSPVAVAISSQEDGRILQMNNAFCALTGYPAEEILGRSGAELGLWQDMAQRKAFMDEIALRKVALNRELGMFDRSGRSMHVLCSAAVIDIFREQCVLWLVSDITERKMLELELVDARERAEAASRAKSDFLANVSHEIRSPMNAILGLTELSLRQAPSGKLRGYLEKVTSASHVLLGVINDLLDLSKIEAGRMELCPAPFDLGALLDRIRDICQSKAEEKGIGFTLTVQGGLPMDLVGDSLRLEQILINLSGNAVKFTEKGEVAVAVTGQMREHGKLELSFVVRDTGIGMTEEQLGRIFTPFVQAESSMSRRFGGTGLGLAIVRRLTDMMGGRVDVVSAPGHGSAFTVTVRFDVDPSGAAARTGGLEDGEALRGKRVLVVDDNALNRELALELLLMAGVEAEAVEGGREALDLLARQSFDAALLDVQMPVMDGYELARAIRSRMPDSGMALLALTAHAMSGDKERCLEAGMDGYLTKPVMPEVLYATLARFIPGSRADADKAAGG